MQGIYYQQITMTSIWNEAREWARVPIYTWAWYERLERNEYQGLGADMITEYYVASQISECGNALGKTTKEV